VTASSDHALLSSGEVPERSIGAVSKTVVPLLGTEGSNPSLSVPSGGFETHFLGLRPGNRGRFSLSRAENVLAVPIFVQGLASKVDIALGLVIMWA
jgi:hypothetical protein